MAKQRTLFFCKSCGFESPKWVGKCPSCGEWNTFTEAPLAPAQATVPGFASAQAAAPQLLSTVPPLNDQRIVTTDHEMNRVLGGGIVPGSVVLVGGEPGIGKSTLMLQLALQMSDLKVMYISGEESAAQIRLRADRMALRPSDPWIFTETDTQRIFAELKSFQPQWVIVDSIQTLYSPLAEGQPGSLSQIRQVTAEWIKWSKQTHIPVFIIGHITKEGQLAGPKMLEHMVDTVLMFEGERHHAYRLLRTLKNRFGSTAELGIYEMTGEGLRQVANPSELLLSTADQRWSGMATGSFMEGNRPLLVEVQSLVSPSAYGTPQRSTIGFDGRRLNMLLAVLEKRTGLKTALNDVFVNLAGGIRVDDPALDLAVCASLLAAVADKVLSEKTIFMGEIGLSGEIRPVARIEQRLAELDRLGYKKCWLSAAHAAKLNFQGACKLHFLSHISEMAALFNG